MRKLSARWKKIIALASVCSLLVFGSLIYRYLAGIHKDIPQVPCSASIDFVHADDDKGIWQGRGDMIIDPKEGALYVYYRVESPEGKQYVYNRRFELSLKRIDTSRYLFKTTAISTFDGDTAENNIPFMARGFQGGVITFSFFSEFDYYFNINNLVIGVCQVPR